MSRNTFVLGAGMTGLAAGFAADLPVFEAADAPGGICSSYYVRPGYKERHMQAPTDEEAFRFEIGGGHWIFGGDPAVLHFMERFVKLKRYVRKSSVYFQDERLYVPFPLQNHLRSLDRDLAERALAEMAERQGPFATMQEWLGKNFGRTLCELFFYPFNELYTAGLYNRIAPQDAYKSPVDLSLAIQGALGQTNPAGYNATFAYPERGLNVLAHALSNQCRVEHGKRVIQIDTRSNTLSFDDGSSRSYETLISTLPLNRVAEMTDMPIRPKPDPYTSVLVLNIGAVRGERCPDDHWLYTPDALSGFHRVGFYSNVDPSFLPLSARPNRDKVGIYVERAYLGGNKPSGNDIARYVDSTIRELQNWGFIGEPEVSDPTWIDVAYTWAWPGSDWKQVALETLQKHGIYQVGRYGRWIFQGIADSIRDGLLVGSAFKGRNDNHTQRHVSARPRQ
ncbi:MAG: FAD-dependent oxidoreductase [Thermodesulfobacteriota bacterium]|nr:FAD-dependent oxidoreductase [Thermodesulfobacteriota bacterium]